MPTTEEVVAGMLVENTGSHMLDSGGAYGRMWQRNQKAVGEMTPVEFFQSRPEARIEFDYVLVDLFHWLCKRVDYAPELDRRFRLWVRMDRSDRWSDSYRCDNSYGTIEEFHDAWKAKGWIDTHDEWTGHGGLTYNHENCVSQDFHWFFFATSEESPVGADLYAFVNIHNGCDARGGYTDFRAFRVGDYDGACDLLGFDKAEVAFTCAAGHRGYASLSGGYVELFDDQGDNLDDEKDLDLDDRLCPICGVPATFTAYDYPVG